MAVKIKNVAEGYTLPGGKFHPYRASPDYDGSELKIKEKGPKWKPGKKAAARRKAMALKRKHKAQVASHKRVASKKTAAQIKKSLAPKSAAGKRVAKAKNPKAAIPKNWTKAKVKRLSNGDIQVMLS